LREAGELPFHDFDEQTIAWIDGRLDYPRTAQPARIEVR
jgi:hypothetical protein